jgi:hypothetical protein
MSKMTSDQAGYSYEPGELYECGSGWLWQFVYHLVALSRNRTPLRGWCLLEYVS